MPALLVALRLKFLQPLVELEDFFQQLMRGRGRDFHVEPLNQFHQVFSPCKRLPQGPVGLIQDGRVFQAEPPFVVIGALVKVRMEFPAQFVEPALQVFRVDLK